MEAKWSSLASYGMSLDALQDFLPLALTLDVKTLRYDTRKVAKRLEGSWETNPPALQTAAPVIGSSCHNLRAPSQWALTGDTCAIGVTSSRTSRSLWARVSELWRG
jgi:hypothetical protein